MGYIEMYREMRDDRGDDIFDDKDFIGLDQPLNDGGLMLQLELWLTAGFTPLEGLRWAEAGYTPSQARRLADDGWAPETATDDDDYLYPDEPDRSDPVADGFENAVFAPDGPADGPDICRAPRRLRRARGPQPDPLFDGF